jgi:hypothetical protein
MRSAGAALADFCCVLLFVAIGRANHHAGGAVAGLWDTFWPFAVGAAAGMAVTRFWRRPTALVPTGVGVWLGTVAAADVISRRKAGTALAFILVALAFSACSAGLAAGVAAASGSVARSGRVDFEP